jgi:hypothetical protein
MAGQGTGWWEKVQNKEVEDPWQKMLEQDPNNQIAVFNIPKDKLENES